VKASANCEERSSEAGVLRRSDLHCGRDHRALGQPRSEKRKLEAMIGELIRSRLEDNPVFHRTRVMLATDYGYVEFDVPYERLEDSKERLYKDYVAPAIETLLAQRRNALRV
jgi:transposase